MGLFYSANSSSVLSSVGREAYGVVSGFLNLVRNSANVISLAIATTIVTVTMGSMGFEPSLEAVRTNSVEGVRGAFTVGLRYAFYALIALVIASMTVRSCRAGRKPRPAPNSLRLKEGSRQQPGTDEEQPAGTESLPVGTT